MNIEIIVSRDMSQNCYIVYDEKKNALVIDPGEDGTIIYEKLNSLGLKLNHILLTHCHFDHIRGCKTLKELTDAKVVSTFECNIDVQNPKKNLSSFFGEPFYLEGSDIIINDNEIFYSGSFVIKAISTPGHTRCGVCYLIGDSLFSGDTLFLRSVGRWDFAGGDEQTLKNSIKNKLFSLDDDVIVYPGHGNITKIYYEKNYNVFVREK